MIAVPIILTYLTNYIELPVIFEKWEFSIIASMTVLIGILIYELSILSGRLKKVQEKPKKTDKKIVRELLETLKIDKFHEGIVNQDAWNGYYHKDIYRIIEFQEKARLVGYKTSSDHVNGLINNFLNRLDEFSDYTNDRVYGRGQWLIPFKENPESHPHERIKMETAKMNELASKSFIELEILMDYLKEHEYV